MESNGKTYPSNYITNKLNNRKYNIFTFLPLFLYNEYKYFANFYFLMLAVVQIWPPIRVGFLITYIGPIIMVTGLSLIKELWDEIKIAGKDKIINSEDYLKLTSKGDKIVKSQDIRVGDIIRMSKKQRIPADLLLLHTSDPSGTTFVRTDQLDGETDWKVREAIKFTQKQGSIRESNIINLRWSVITEQPSDLIYDFKGSFFSEEGNIHLPLKLNHTIWANMTLASGEAIGLVIYAGKETKMAMNSRKSKSKIGKTDLEINTLSKMLFCILGALTILFFILSGNLTSPDWYVFITRTFIILSFVIPISMKVNVDFAKLYYSLLINQDEQIPGTIARNSSIPEELGRIEYLLSDKTGTLTRNEMIFKHLVTQLRCYNTSNFDDLKQVLYTIYLNNADGQLEELIKNCLLCFVLCNNVSPIIDNNERILQASSPDEVALVEFAETLGFKLIKRLPNRVEISTPGDQVEAYEVLNIFPFSSETKRMGIILRNEQTGEYTFFLKGADTVMQEKVTFEEKIFIEEETENLSKEGLRTLVLCYKPITEKDYQQFSKKMVEAGKNLKRREKEERKIVTAFEHDMNLLCITGVEDLLQEDIKPVIQNIREAGIKVWMLTGDKLETAKCIAISTAFKTHQQRFYDIQTVFEGEIRDKLADFDPNEYALLVTGKTLEVILKQQGLREYFFEKAKEANSVILCRCAPKQKALVALYLKDYLNKIVCCIGDGGNDVGMIQSANIGIGIEGKEGRQAALASDFSVLKFKHILKLFLWHGRLSYTRTSLLSNFVVHRGLIITIIQLYFMMIFFYITMTIYNGYMNMCYGTIFTNFPVFALIWDVDIPLHQAFNYPSLYYLVQKGQNLSKKVFLIWLWKSVFQGSVIILLSLRIFDNTFTEIVTITFTALILIEFINIYSSIRTWHYVITMSICLSAFFYLISLFFLKDLFNLGTLTLSSFSKIMFIAMAASLPIELTKAIKRMFFPSQIDKVIREARLKEKRMRLGAKIQMHNF